MDNQDINDREKVRKLRERMEALVKTKLEDAGLKVEFQESDIWEFRPGENVLKYIPKDLYTLSDRGVIAEVVHNIGHALYSQKVEFESLELPEPTEQFFQLANQVEDIRVEEQMMQLFPGTHNSFLYKFMFNDSQISSEVEQKLPPHAMFTYMLAKNFWGKMKPEEVPPEVQQALTESEDILFDAFNAEKSDEMLDIVLNRLWPLYQRLLPEPPPPKPNGGGGGDKEGKGDDEQEGEGGGSGGSGASDAESQQLESLAKEALDIEKVMEAMKQMSEGRQPTEGEKETFGKDIDKMMDEQEKKEEESSQMIDAKDPVFGGHGATPPSGEDIDQFPLNYEAMYHEIMPMLPVFKKKLNSIMKDNRYNRFGGNYRTGKLSTKKLWRWKAGSDKLFTRKIHRKHKDYKVTIMVDESGSMHGEKSHQAAKASVLFAEVLDAVGIDFEVRGFNGRDYTYKNFNEKFGWKHRRAMEAISKFTHTSHCGCNNDGWAVNLSADSLRKASTRETERIMFVLSDGWPADSSDAIPAEHKKRLPSSKWHYNNFDLKTEVEAASKDCMVVGVGIQDRSVERYYPQSIVCQDVSELPALVLNSLKSRIRRG